GEHLEELRRRAPRNTQVLFLLATFRRSLRQFAEAREALDEFLVLKPDDANALLVRGRIDMDADRPAEAEPFLRRAFARAPDDPGAALALSRCLHELKQEAESKRLQEEYRRLESARSLQRQEMVRKGRSGAGQPPP